MEDIIECISYEKIEKDYPTQLLRLNKDSQIVPAYFNIDALLERWELYYTLFTSKELLYNRLKSQGHIIIERPIYHEFTEDQKESLALIKNNKSEDEEQQLQEAKQNLLQWDSLTDNENKERLLENYIRNSKKRVNRYYRDFKKFSPYYRTEYLAELLLEYTTVDERIYKRFINSLVLWTLADNHPFKLLFLGTFDYKSHVGANNGCVRINVSYQEANDKMNNICKSYFVGYPIDQGIVSSLFPCMFKIGPTKKLRSIIGLNPLNIEEPTQRIPNNINQQELRQMMILK